MTTEVDDLLAMFDAGGVPAEIVSVDGETITVSMPDGGCFAITPHADEYGRCWRARRYFGPDDLGWYGDHHSPGMVDQVRAGLYGRGENHGRGASDRTGGTT